MYTNNLLLASSALLSLVAAVPLNKRDMVWVTTTVEDVVTVPFTTTVWVNPGEPTVAAAAYAEPSSSASAPEHYGHHGHFGQSSSAAQPAPTVQPAAQYSAPAAPPAPVQPSSQEAAPVHSSSVYVAPPAPTSVYVAPASTYEAPAPAPTTSSSVYEAPPAPAPTTSTSVYEAPPAPAPTTSSSVYQAPPAPAPTTTSVYVAPAPTSTWEAPAATTAASPAYSGSSSGGVSSLTGSSHSGDLTYYDVGMGACGIDSSASQAVVAVSHVLFDLYTPNGNPNKNPLCGMKVNIKGTEATIVDRCVGCQEWDLDLSTGLWAIVEPTGDGRVHNVGWSFA